MSIWKIDRRVMHCWQISSAAANEKEVSNIDILKELQSIRDNLQLERQQRISLQEHLKGHQIALEDQNKINAKNADVAADSAFAANAYFRPRAKTLQRHWWLR